MTTPWSPASFNPHDPAFIKNPYPTYAQFRAQAPIAWVDQYQAWWIFKYADVKAVLTGTALYLKHQVTPPFPPAPPLFDVLGNMPNGIFTLDNPRHDTMRAVVEPLFRTAIANAATVAAVAAKPLLVAAKASRRVELINAYALPLPAGVLRTVMGIPSQDWPGLVQWVGAILLADDPTQPISVQAAGGTCTMALRAYYQALAGGGPVQADVGKLFNLLVTEGSGPLPKLSPEEVQANAVTLSIAGYLSTTFLIGTGTLNLLNNPDQLAMLRARPDLIHPAVNEMLRYDGPVQLIDRYLARDAMLGGHQFHAGDKVTVVVGSANHDPDVFANPDAFDITRSETAHLSFGDGIHRCLGEPLLRLVAPVAIQALLQEFVALRVEGTPQWQTDPYLRAVSNLPVAIA